MVKVIDVEKLAKSASRERGRGHRDLVDDLRDAERHMRQRADGAFGSGHRMTSAERAQWTARDYKGGRS